MSINPLARRSIDPLSAIQPFLLDSDDLVVSIQFHTSHRAIRILNGADIAFLRALDYSDKDANEPVSQTAIHA